MDKGKYRRLCALASRMLADAVRSAVIRDVAAYAARFAVHLRPPPADAAEGAEAEAAAPGWAGRPEAMPVRLEHGVGPPSPAHSPRLSMIWIWALPPAHSLNDVECPGSHCAY